MDIPKFVSRKLIALTVYSLIVIANKFAHNVLDAATINNLTIALVAYIVGQGAVDTASMLTK